MKIIVLSEDFLPNIGGIAWHIYYMTRCFANNGHSVEIVNPIFSDKNEILISIDGNMTIHTIHISTNFPGILKRIIFNLKTFAYTRKLIRKQFLSQVIIHQHDYISTALSGNLLKNNKSVYVWTNHSSNFLTNLDNFSKRLAVKVFYTRANGIIAPSKELLERSCEVWPNKKAVYIPNGVDANEFSPISIKAREFLKGKLRLPSKKTICLCPRRWEPKNGVSYLIEAIRTLKEKGDKCLENTVFLFTGNYGRFLHYEKQIFDQIKEHRLEKYVSPLGEVPHEEMHKLVNCSDVVIIPSLIEAVSLSALEAMACEKPLIATNVGGLQAIVRDRETGFLVNPGDPIALACTIAEVCEGLNEQWMLEMTKKARELVVKEYSWDALATMTTDFYQEILDSTAP